MLRNLTLMIAMALAITLALSAPHASAAAGKSESVSHGPRRQLSTIVFAGLAGAILGLSTLSFYGRPQDRLDNIAVGAAIGIIGGAMYTTFKAATEPRDFYGSSRTAGDELIALSEIRPAATPTPTLGMSFNF